MELSKAYNAQEHEDRIYKEWEHSGFFTPENLPGERTEPFAISLPPPNATGKLHLGHATMLAIEDLMIRFERMRGKKTLWVPGVDHAAIATQNVVEKALWNEEKKTRHDVGREELLRRIEMFVADAKKTIEGQMRKMGTSCDWSRERYTMDDGLSRAVRTIFVRMYDDGLIYRGNRIVNWCPRCQSTLSDDEVNYKEQQTILYTFRYDENFPEDLAISTTRPETKFGDTAVALHPDDPRAKAYAGKTFIVDLGAGPQEIRVVADPIIDRTFGTGVLGVTPAHSAIDEDLARRHGLPMKQVIDEFGKMDVAGAYRVYRKMSALDARKKLVESLREKKLLTETPITHNLSVCYRCDSPIEPLPKLQWFVAVGKTPKSGGKSMKDRARDVVRDGSIRIVPDRFEKTYFHWMDNLRDWCISRQIWFGHRVPAYYCIDCDRNFIDVRLTSPPQSQSLDSLLTGGTVSVLLQEFSISDVLAKKPEIKNARDGATPFVSLDGKELCPRCNQGNTVFQDPDTLDTWFSSGLWTFSTLGWPDKTKELATYHPTNVLETGYDILFFWVARMILMTTYALDEVPFKTVYLHGLVRDKQGRKMSKSLGNGIDPIEVIDKYGADALRLALIIGATPGNDVRLYDEKIAGYRNFVNKIWNIGRYVGMQNQESRIKNQRDETLADRWISSRFAAVVASVTEDLAEYQFSRAGETLRAFTWDDFADWYLEVKKIEGDVSGKARAMFMDLLKLWHPFTPFVTEVLWKELGGEGMLMVAEWPRHPVAASQIHALSEVEGANFKLQNDSAYRFERVQAIVTAIRNARSVYRIPPATKIAAQIVAGDDAAWLSDEAPIMSRLARLGTCTVQPSGDRLAQTIALTVGATSVFLSVPDSVDLAKERARIEKEIEEKAAYVLRLEQKLSNGDFIANAKEDIVAAERARLDAAREELERRRSLLQ